MTETMFVIYPAREGAKFDRDYYTATHLPLVREQWGPHGLRSVNAFYPGEENPSHVAVAVLLFEGEGAIDEAIGSPAAQVVFSDVPRFTDIQPVRLKGSAF